MAYKTFAAIDVGSYELAMKIYEISNIFSGNNIVYHNEAMLKYGVKYVKFSLQICQLL